MADFVFNQAKGRISELANRVNANDPANSIFGILVLEATGIETDAVLRDKDTVADLLSGTTDEALNTGYARKTLDDAGGLTVTVDDTNDRTDVDCPDQTWTAVSGGDNWSDLVFFYDADSTAGTDANLTPLTQHDFVVTIDGGDITAQINAAGFARAA